MTYNVCTYLHTELEKITLMLVVTQMCSIYANGLPAKMCIISLCHSIESTPTHSAKSDWADSKMSSSFAAESEAFIESFIEFGQKKDEDAESIKEGEEEMKLTTIDETAEVQKDDADRPVAVANTSFGLGDVVVGSVTEDEESNDEDAEAKDMDKDEFGLTTAAATVGEQNDKVVANGKGSSEGN